MLGPTCTRPPVPPPPVPWVVGGDVPQSPSCRLLPNMVEVEYGRSRSRALPRLPWAPGLTTDRRPGPPAPRASAQRQPLPPGQPSSLWPWPSYPSWPQGPATARAQPTASSHVFSPAISRAWGWMLRGSGPGLERLTGPRLSSIDSPRQRIAGAVIGLRGLLPIPTILEKSAPLPLCGPTRSLLLVGSVPSAYS